MSAAPPPPPERGHDGAEPAARSAERWLRSFPRPWRERYGDELHELILATSAGGRLPWRTRLDLLRGGAREHMHGWGLGSGVPPTQRARAGVLLVLGAWAVSLTGGVVLQRFTENWRQVTPAADQGVPASAYETVGVAAALAGALVLGGIACALPRYVAFLRTGGWVHMRGATFRALRVTAVAGAATVAIVAWARGLDSAQRNGHDALYEAGFLVWALILLGCLTAWTAVAVRGARRIELPRRWLAVEVSLAAGASLSILAITVATVVWWVSLAHAAPWALSDHAAPWALSDHGGGTSEPVVTAPLLLAGAVLAAGSGLAVIGAGRALLAMPRLPSR